MSHRAKGIIEENPWIIRFWTSFICLMGWESCKSSVANLKLVHVRNKYENNPMFFVADIGDKIRYYHFSMPMRPWVGSWFFDQYLPAVEVVFAERPVAVDRKAADAVAAAAVVGPLPGVGWSPGPWQFGGPHTWNREKWIFLPAKVATTKSGRVQSN